MTGEPGGRPSATGRVVQLTPERPAVAPAPPATPPRARRATLAGLTPRERRAAELTRGAVGAHLVAAAAGLVGADYVGAADFSLVLPLLSGLACAWWVSRASSGLPRLVRDGLAGGYGATSAAFAFVYSDTPYGALGSWLPPLLAGVLGGLAWPLVDPAPPNAAGKA